MVDAIRTVDGRTTLTSATTEFVLFLPDAINNFPKARLHGDSRRDHSYCRQRLFVFAYDEGTPAEMREAKNRFNEAVGDSYRLSTKSALVSGFHRPDDREFRAEFINQCRKYLRRKGQI